MLACIEGLDSHRGDYSRGHITVGPGKSYSVPAHRVAFEQAWGPVPAGLDVMHTCDNPPCINPMHLMIGTRRTNLLDMTAKRRHRNNRKTHCPAGHEYSSENTYVWRKKRYCRGLQEGLDVPSSLQRVIRKGGSGGGTPLPDAYPSLAEKKIRFRRSELVMIAAQPATGKSAFALNLALQTGVPTLYVSVDSGAHTQVLRLLAMLTGMPQDSIEPVMAGSPDWVEETIGQAGHIRWCFDSSPTLDTIEDELDAFITLYGEPPQLLIIDNVTDIDASASDEWATLRALMRVLKDWARTMDMCVLALHHTSESKEAAGNPCPPRSAVQGKVSQIPAMIVTLHAEEGVLMVAPVKNRHGKADYTGSTYVSLGFYGDTMAMIDPLHAAGGARA